jgi:hypothetical protein
VPSLPYSIGILLALTALLLWARHRAAALRARSAERERASMATLLAGASSSEARTAAVDVSSPVDGGSPQREPLARHEPAQVPSAPEQAAAGLDPIEELISHIVPDEPAAGREPAAAPRPAVRRHARAPVQNRPEPDSLGSGVPLREIVLAWYESRGYRGSPASPAVWPIELVLRHRDDAARAYAFVVQNDYISLERVTALIEQAREIGMLRVAIVAEAGYEDEAKAVARKRRVRLIDRQTMEAELSALELPTAAKIIAVARTRASTEAVPAA